MMRDKRSFLERLTGSTDISDDSISDEVEENEIESLVQSEKDAELAVDMFQTSDAIILRTFVAGVRAEDLDVNIARDMITIKGVRKPEKIATGDNLFVNELYWGSFSRTLTLPSEIDVEESEAVHKNGLLTIIMPKLDKKKQMKVKIRSSD